MADLATTVQAMPSGRSLLDSKLRRRPAARASRCFVLAVAGGLCYIAFHLAGTWNGHVSSIWPYLLLGLGAAHRARLRVRQRLSRYRQCRGYGYLHPLDGAEFRGGLVGPLQPGRSAPLLRRRGLCHHHAAAGRADSSGKLRRRLRHGFCAADRRHCLESRYLVVWPAGFQFAHHGGFHHRRGHRQPVDARAHLEPRAWIGSRPTRSSRRC